MRPYIDCHNHIGRTINRRPPVGQTTAMSLARFAETSVYAALNFPPRQAAPSPAASRISGTRTAPSPGPAGTFPPTFRSAWPWQRPASATWLCPKWNGL